jgi:hypothetical protein
MYTRKAGSRSEPDGRLFILMSVPPPSVHELATWVGAKFDDDGSDDDDDDDDDDDGDDDDGGGDDDDDGGEGGEVREGEGGGGEEARDVGSSDTPRYIIKNSNFGAGEFDNKQGWVWGAQLPAHLAGCGLTTSPVDGGAALYVPTAHMVHALPLPSHCIRVPSSRRRHRSDGSHGARPPTPCTALLSLCCELHHPVHRVRAAA